MLVLQDVQLAEQERSLLDTAVLMEAGRPRCARPRPSGATQRSTILSRRARKCLVAQLARSTAERGLVRERAEQTSLLFGQLHVLEHQHPDGSEAHHQGDRDPARPALSTSPRERA